MRKTVAVLVVALMGVLSSAVSVSAASRVELPGGPLSTIAGFPCGELAAKLKGRRLTPQQVREGIRSKAVRVYGGIEDSFLDVLVGASVARLHECGLMEGDVPSTPLISTVPAPIPVPKAPVSVPATKAPAPTVKAPVSVPATKAPAPTVKAPVSVPATKAPAPTVKTPAPAPTVKTPAPTVKTPAPASTAKAPIPATKAPAPTVKASVSVPATKAPAPTVKASVSVPATKAPAPTAKTPAPTHNKPGTILSCDKLYNQIGHTQLTRAQIISIAKHKAEQRSIPSLIAKGFIPQVITDFNSCGLLLKGDTPAEPERSPLSSAFSSDLFGSS